MGLAVLEFALVAVAVGVALVAAPVAEVGFPAAFVEPVFLVEHHAEAVPLGFFDLAVVDRALAGLAAEIRLLGYFGEVEDRAFHLVAFRVGH